MGKKVFNSHQLNDKHSGKRPDITGKNNNVSAYFHSFLVE